MHLAPAYLAAMLLASPALSQDMSVIEACGTDPLGEGSCQVGDLAEALGLLDRGAVRVFGDVGVESYAMLTSLRYAASTLAFLDDGEPCIAEEERYAAVEIWSLWVALPDSAPEIIKEKFDVYEGVMDKIVNLELEC